jgi:RNA polymerase sigma-70 factor (ECF subfamily)
MRETRTPAYVSYSVRNGASLKHFFGRLLRGFSNVEDIAPAGLLLGDVAEHNRASGQPKSALLRIAKCLALSQLMHKTQQITEYMEDSAEPTVIHGESSAQREIDLREMLRLHCEAVIGLAPECRQIYLLRKVHSFSHKDIAAHVGVAVSAVEKTLIEAVEHCDRYVRQRTDSRPRNAPNRDQRDGHVSVEGRKSGERRESRYADLDRARGKEVARSDGWQ